MSLAPATFLQWTTTYARIAQRACKYLECGDLSPLYLAIRFEIALMIGRRKRAKRFNAESGDESPHSKVFW